MFISIIICTRNRAADLVQTLLSFQYVRVPATHEVELIVVDNGSTDNTRAIVESSLLPQLTVCYLYEPRQGQCNARNSGLAHAQGEILLLTDDDVRVPVNWIEAMCAPILRDEADVVAGGVRLTEALRRPWQTPLLRVMLADTEYFQKISYIGLVGANFAMSRKALNTVPRFDTELDPGTVIGLGGDTLYRAQLGAAEFRICGQYDVCLEHCPSPDRLTRKSFLSAADKGGRYYGYELHHWMHATPSLPYLRLLRWRFALAIWCARNRTAIQWTEGIMEEEFQLLVSIGKFKQYLMERKRPRNYDRCGLIKHGEEPTLALADTVPRVRRGQEETPLVL